jgi:glycosyltransferase involved in cell wall biosynthesis
MVVMDCDLQDPPEEIPRLYAKARDGHDVVFARRVERQPASRVRAHAGRAYFRLLNLVAGTDIDRSYGTFSIIARKVADAYLEFRRPRPPLPVHPLLAGLQPGVDRLPGGAATLGRELLRGRRPPAPRGSTG